MLRLRFTPILLLAAASFGSAAAAQNLPVAEAGESQVIDCALPEGAGVTLDGTGSSDADLQPLTYSWTDATLAVLSTEPMPTLLLAPGTHVITLIVNDGVDGDSLPDTVLITVNADVTPPDLVLASDADESWPPNHKLRGYEVADIAESVSDDCSELTLDDVVFGHATSDEPDDGLGDGSTNADVQFSDDCQSADVRSERSGGGDGRVYELVLQVADEAGNLAEETYTISVPHDRAHDANDSGDVSEYESACGGGDGLSVCPAAPTPACTAASAGDAELGSGPKGASLRWRSSGFAAGSVAAGDNLVCVYVDGAAAGGALSPDKVKVRGKKGQGALDVAARGGDLGLPALPLASGAVLRLELHDGAGDCVSYEEAAH